VVEPVRKPRNVFLHAVEYTHAQLADGLPVIEGKAIGERVPNERDRAKIRAAFNSLGLVKTGRGVSYDPFVWVKPVRADADLKAERDRRYANRHDRHKVKRSLVAADVGQRDFDLDVPF
jgi:hypothetical protein